LVKNSLRLPKGIGSRKAYKMTNNTMVKEKGQNRQTIVDATLKA